MTETQQVEDFEQIIEKIVFDENELEELRSAIRTFTDGKITPKQLKQKLIQCRERMVDDITEFVYFFIEKSRKSEPVSVTKSSNVIILGLRKELKDKSELLEIVAHKLNQTVLNLKKN